MDHYNPPSRLFKRANKLVKDAVVTFISEDTVEVEFPSTDPTGPNVVHCNENGLWFCTCQNYHYSKKPGYGEYMCKHMLAAIIFLSKMDFQNPSKDGDIQLTF